CPRGGSQVLLQRVDAAQVATNKRTISIGETNGRTIEVLAEFGNAIESFAIVNSAAMVMSHADEAKLARDERCELATIWPINEIRAQSEGVVLNGQMRDLMASAQRIASTKINVLITGESGTGKEIIARAIHSFSDRAAKPFVPLNCAAVPRELL